MDAALTGAIRDAAYLEGDFVLRSGRRSSYYLDKYRFGTDPDLLRPLGEAIAREVREREPEATRIAAPELGGVPRGGSAVRDRPQGRQGIRNVEPDRGCVRRGRDGLPRRGRRHLRRRRRRRRPCAPRRGAARLGGGLRRRPRGGRRRRACPPRRSAVAAPPRLGARGSSRQGAWVRGLSDT